MTLLHGHRAGGYTPTYNTWRAMRARCCYEQHPYYGEYGGRGIRVCAAWDTFAGFLADMGERPAGLTLDRIDVDGDYTPANCRWASLHEQRWNRRDMAARLRLLGENPDWRPDWAPAPVPAPGMPF